MGGFTTILLEGIFYEEGAHLVVRTEVGVVPVAAKLAPLLGARVQFAAHHLPPNPPDLQRWGGGSCLWEGTGSPCPAGHGTHPLFLFNVSSDGVLTEDGGAWFLDRFDGTRTPLHLRALIGHYGRIATATLLSVEAMRDVLASNGVEGVEDLGVRADELREILTRIKG